MKKTLDILTELIVTFFYLGRIKYAPGTFGSLAAFPITYCIISILINTRFLFPLQGFSEGEREFITIAVCMFLVIGVLSIIGVIASRRYMENNKTHDPKEIVIDEVVGQMLTSTLTMISVAFVYNSPSIESLNKPFVDWMCFFIMPFVLFRACDIIKPWPIKWIDKNITTAFGVFFDDIVAALLASVLQYAIIIAYVS
ncbi:MAG: hypothetical protein RLZZ59_400 [Pseudomonadota bacterium]